ncbi:MAG: hypothetical protein CM15mP17_00070 [Gammaproteobacteria bacterium]|nr:MAG: hypothetical protein CM15mP17_00070 [Gammaproteobacteria bacterium]
MWLYHSSNDTEALRESILSLINNKDLRNLYGVSSREVAKNLSWDNDYKNLTLKIKPCLIHGNRHKYYKNNSYEN